MELIDRWRHDVQPPSVQTDLGASRCSVAVGEPESDNESAPRCPRLVSAPRAGRARRSELRTNGKRGLIPGAAPPGAGCAHCLSRLVMDVRSPSFVACILRLPRGTPAALRLA